MSIFQIYVHLFHYMKVKVHLVCDIGAAEIKVNWLLWFLCVDLADSHHPTLLQE